MSKVTILFMGIGFFGIFLVEQKRYKEGERIAALLAVPAFLLYFLLAVLIVAVDL